jgi:hypothetical protein
LLALVATRTAAAYAALAIIGLSTLVAGRQARLSASWLLLLLWRRRVRRLIGRLWWARLLELRRRRVRRLIGRLRRARLLELRRRRMRRLIGRLRRMRLRRRRMRRLIDRLRRARLLELPRTLLGLLWFRHNGGTRPVNRGLAVGS